MPKQLLVSENNILIGVHHFFWNVTLLVLVIEEPSLLVFVVVSEYVYVFASFIILFAKSFSSFLINEPKEAPQVGQEKALRPTSLYPLHSEQYFFMFPIK
jgi:hypothetical protein